SRHLPRRRPRMGALQGRAHHRCSRGVRTCAPNRHTRRPYRGACPRDRQCPRRPHGERSGAVRACRAAVLAAVFVAVHPAAPAQAHELGVNRVEITVQDDGRYDVVIVTNPAALLARLELLRADAARRQDVAGTDGERLAGLAGVLLAHVHVRAGDAETRPELVPDFHRIPAAQGRGPDEWAVRLSGHLPAGAERITWQCAFVYGSYAVVVRARAASGRCACGSGRTAPMFLAGA